jgi:hypothetical protein
LHPAIAKPLDAHNQVAAKMRMPYTAANALEVAKQRHKTHVKTLGAKLDKTAKQGGGKGTAGDDVKFQNIATFLGEADGFLAQATTVIQIGKQNLQLFNENQGEKNAAQRARSAWYDTRSKTIRYAQRLVGSANTVTKDPTKQHFEKREQSFTLGGNGSKTANDTLNGAGSTPGTNSKIDDVIRDAEGWVVKVTAYRDTFRRVLTG